MKATELRIRNLVEDEYKRVQIVEEMDIPFAKDYYIISFKGDCYAPSDKVFPIPLTEEWLLKFGFEKIEDKMFGYHEYRKGNHSFNLKGGWLENGFSQINETSIQYVHQLQNLYFALTGNELTIEK